MARRRGRWQTTLALVALTAALAAGCSATTPASTVARVSPTSSDSADPTVEGSGPALHCPARAPTRVSAPNGAPKADVPVPGSPVEALVCEYAGLNRPEPVGALLAHHLVGRPSALAAAVDGSQLFGAGPYVCPNDDGSMDLLQFGYADGSTNDVRVGLRGCPGVDSLSFHTPARWASPQLLLLLKESAH